MNDSNAFAGLLGIWMLAQLILLLALLLGGLYALYCLGRAASGLDRLAGAIEEWVARENASSAPPLPGALPRPAPVPMVPPAPPVPPLRPMDVPLATEQPQEEQREL